MDLHLNMVDVREKEAFGRCLSVFKFATRAKSVALPNLPSSPGPPSAARLSSPHTCRARPFLQGRGPWLRQRPQPRPRRQPAPTPTHSPSIIPNDPHPPALAQNALPQAPVACFQAPGVQVSRQKPTTTPHTRQRRAHHPHRPPSSTVMRLHRMAALHRPP